LINASLKLILITKSFFTKFYIEKYKISDDRVQKWQILKEKEKLENFEVQKATLDFAGRNG
jgi:GLPGLI family protein